MTKLKPCPFCGGRMLFVGTVAETEMTPPDHPDFNCDSNQYNVVCDFTAGGCGASSGKGYESEEEAIEAWNRRADNANAT